MNNQNLIALLCHSPTPNLCCTTLTSCRPSHPDNAGGLQHHPGPLHARHLAPLQVGGVGALYGLVHLLGPAGHHLTQDTTCREQGALTDTVTGLQGQNTRIEVLLLLILRPPRRVILPLCGLCVGLFVSRRRGKKY